MDENSKAKVSLNSLKKAKYYYKELNYGRAFAHYLVFFELQENKRPTYPYQRQFTDILCFWGRLLEQRNQFEDLCKCYLQALNYFPKNVEILNNFGEHLMRLNEYEEARKYLELSHSLSSTFLAAEKNLMTVKGELVERWHFPMLNDYERNMAYYKAILAYSAEINAKVIDIGTGCGLLSLFASNNDNVESIFAIEASKTISSMANDIFHTNNMTKVKVFNKHSTELNNEDNRPFDLLITEIFDVGLFGEHALESLIHAWNNLLDKKAKIIPASASLYITGIESVELLKMHKLINKYPDFNLHNICVCTNDNEPYDSKNLKLIPYKAITETKCVLNVDFANLIQLTKLQSGDSHLETLKIISPGQVDAFAIWFDLKLDDNNIITTNPDKENIKCWEQAIIYVNHPNKYEINANLQIILNCHNGRLEIDLVDQIKDHANCFKVSSDVISFLNDEIAISNIEKLYNDKYSNKNVLDLFPFPILGLKYAKNNICYCIAKNGEDKLFIEHIVNLNNIPKENVIIFDGFDYHSKITRDLLKFDIISINPVSQNGAIDENTILNLNTYKTWLKPEGILYPKLLNLHCQIIKSDYLLNFNVVNDENTFGFHIAAHINEYSVNEHYDLDKNFQHKKLSQPVCLGNILNYHEDLRGFKDGVSILQPDKVDAILYWFELVFDDEITINTSLCSCYNFACFLVDRYEIINQTDELILCIKQHKGLLKIYCET